ncbi:VOC family protein [Pseudomonas sp. C11]|uniref:VOC family protein n=1 Tax=Pseudomonas sp. C11 TaxID=3075550 RepID=UPI002AFFADD8|nr:VOC family protein [Pseudomonas sp. C11]
MFTSVGEIVQIAYVVADLDEAMAQWNSLGAGPFFAVRRLEYLEQTYRGEPTDCEIAAAFGYMGNIQIELVQQLNDAPSSFREFLKKHGTGQQHLGILSQNIAGDTERLEAQGFTQIHRMVSTTGVETVLFGTDDHGGTVMELIEDSPALRDAFSQMKAASAEWSPSMPGVIEV